MQDLQPTTLRKKYFNGFIRIYELRLTHVERCNFRKRIFKIPNCAYALVSPTVIYLPDWLELI